MCFGDSHWEATVIRVTPIKVSSGWVGNTLRRQTLLRDSILIGMEIWQLSEGGRISSSPHVWGVTATPSLPAIKPLKSSRICKC